MTDINATPAREPRLAPLTRSKRNVIRIPYPPFAERMIYYTLIPEIFTRVVLELFLGMYSFALVQQRLWVFFILVALEYLYQITHQRGAIYVFRYNLAAGLLFLVLALHGGAIGYGWGNPLGKIATDTIPLIVAAFNIIFASSTKAFDGYSFKRLNRVVIFYCIFMLLIGLAAVSIGRPSAVSIGSAVPTAICLSIILAGILNAKKFDLSELLYYAIIFLLFIPNSNRSNVVILLIASLMVFFAVLIRRAHRLYFTIILLVLAAFVIPATIPEDSPLARRIEGIARFDPSERTGSIGERQAESDAIDDKIEASGWHGRLFGMGNGAIYEIVFSNGYAPESYSNAHYGWALFKLRYGTIGSFYLAMFIILCLLSLVYNRKYSSPNSMLCIILALFSMIYCVTYMNFNIFAAGIQFMWYVPARKIQRHTGLRKPALDAVKPQSRA